MDRLHEISRYTPCDSGDCPYGAWGGMQCRDFCGLGVDEDSPEQDHEDFLDSLDDIFEEVTDEEYDEVIDRLF